MAFDNYEGKFFSDSKKVINVDDNLTVEQALQIKINNELFSVTMRTPGDDKELIRGLLFSEDIYKNLDNELSITLVEKRENNTTTEANVTIKEKLGNGYSNSRNILSASSCGICGKKELDEVDRSNKLIDANQLSIKTLYKMFDVMKKDQPTFHQSGGSHAAAAFTLEGELLSVKEDIGRHNAVDKVIGDLINRRQLSLANCMVVSGRISYEILTKAFSAKIGILAAVSAPSTLAVDFAKELGITLLAFCRDNKATCYAHSYRISELP